MYLYLIVKFHCLEISSSNIANLLNYGILLQIPWSLRLLRDPPPSQTPFLGNPPHVYGPALHTQDRVSKYPPPPPPAFTSK